MNNHQDFIQELILKCLTSQTFFPNCLSCNIELRKEFPNYNWKIPLCRKCRLKYKDELSNSIVPPHKPSFGIFHK